MINIKRLTKLSKKTDNKANNRAGNKTDNKVNNRVDNRVDTIEQDISFLRKDISQDKEKTSASPAAEGGGSHTKKATVSVREIREFSDTVPGSNAYMACDFRSAFIYSHTCFPEDWQEVYRRYVQADYEQQNEFLEKLQNGAYRQKWGEVDGEA